MLSSIDALQRQIGNAPVKRLLFRKNEQTRREGSRHAPPVHGHGCPLSTGTGPGYAAVPVFGPVRIARTAAELCSHSARRLRRRPRRSDNNGGRCARRGAFCSCCTPLVSEAWSRRSNGVCTHGRLAIHMVGWSSTAAGTRGADGKVVVGMWALHGVVSMWLGALGWGATGCNLACGDSSYKSRKRLA